MKPAAAILRWLERFATCVCERDVVAGKQLFATDVCSFGTRTEFADNLHDLVEQQWRPIWYCTTGFRFLPEPLVAFSSSDGMHVCVLALWESEGTDATGRTFPRRGRSTILLEADPTSPCGYRARHTHFSISPARRSDVRPKPDAVPGRISLPGN